MPAAENAAIVERIFDAFARKEGLALRGLFAEDAVWHVPGRGVMAGTYRGRDAIFRFSQRSRSGRTARTGSELIDVLASDDRAAALYRARGERHGRMLESTRCSFFRIEGSRVREVLALPSDADAFESFWA